MRKFQAYRKSSGAAVGTDIEAATYYAAMIILAKRFGMNVNAANRMYYLEEDKPELLPVDEKETAVVPSMDDLIDDGEVDYFGLPMDEDFLSS